MVNKWKKFTEDIKQKDIEILTIITVLRNSPQIHMGIEKIDKHMEVWLIYIPTHPAIETNASCRSFCAIDINSIIFFQTHLCYELLGMKFYLTLLSSAELFGVCCGVLYEYICSRKQWCWTTKLHISFPAQCQVSSMWASMWLNNHSNGNPQILVYVFACPHHYE